jgi:hypothetical protein
MRYQRDFWSTLADEGRPWELWVKYFWYRSRQCSSVPNEPERLRWPSGGARNAWRGCATPLLRRDCVLAMQYISAHGPADDRMRHHHDMPLTKLSTPNCR